MSTSTDAHDPSVGEDADTSPASLGRNDSQRRAEPSGAGGPSGTSINSASGMPAS
jgi:hypothetical protein